MAITGTDAVVRGVNGMEKSRGWSPAPETFAEWGPGTG